MSSGADEAIPGQLPPEQDSENAKTDGAMANSNSKNPHHLRSAVAALTSTSALSKQAQDHSHAASHEKARQDRLRKIEDEMAALEQPASGSGGGGGGTDSAESGARLTRSQTRQTSRSKTKGMLKASRTKGLESSSLGPGGTAWIHSNQASLGFGTLIVLNAIGIGIETDTNRSEEFHLGWYLQESLFLVLFSFELFLRVRSDGILTFTDKSKGASWNCFDAFIVFFGLVDTFILTFAIQSSGMEGFTVLRIIRLARLARLVRLVRFCRELYLLVQGIFNAIRLLFWIFILLIIVFFGFGIFLTRFIGHANEARGEEKDPDIEIWFSNVPGSMATLFQIMTLEGWPEISKKTSAKFPGMALFFMVYILFANILLVNLMTGVIVENVLDTAKNDATERTKMAEKAKMSLLKKLEQYFRDADMDGNGELDQDEFEELISRPEVRHHLANLNVSENEAESLFEVLDVDESATISIDEFIEGIVRSQGNLTPKHLMTLQYDLHKLMRSSNLNLEDALDEVYERIEIVDKNLTDKVSQKINYLTTFILKTAATMNKAQPAVRMSSPVPPETGSATAGQRASLPSIPSSGAGGLEQNGGGTGGTAGAFEVERRVLRRVDDMESRLKEFVNHKMDEQFRYLENSLKLLS